MAAVVRATTAAAAAATGIPPAQVVWGRGDRLRGVDELEAKAREFEVLSSVNLDKILGLLESKEHKINSLQKTDEATQELINSINRNNDFEIA